MKLNKFILAAFFCATLITVSCHDRVESEEKDSKEVNVKMHKWIGAEIYVEFDNEIIVKDLEGNLSKKDSIACVLQDVDEDVLYLLYQESVYWVDTWNIKAVRLNQ